MNRNNDYTKKDSSNLGFIDSIAAELSSSRLQRAQVMAEILNKPVAKRERSRRRYLRRKP